MDGFTGFKTAAAETVPDAVAVMDPFHVVALAGEALDRCRQRVQQQTCGHRGAQATRSTASAACCAPAPTCSPVDSASS
jgi:transposase